jgi:hypothetical protein
VYSVPLRVRVILYFDLRSVPIESKRYDSGIIILFFSFARSKTSSSDPPKNCYAKIVNDVSLLLTAYSYSLPAKHSTPVRNFLCDLLVKRSQIRDLYTFTSTLSV